MPINPKLKEHLQSQTMEASYREKLLSVLEDAPADVQNNWMSQQDYTRQVNAFKTEKADWKVKNDDFYTKSNAAIDGWKAEVQKANDTVATAQARIAELEAGGTVRTPAEEDAVAKEVKSLRDTIGGLTDRLSKVVTEDKLSSAYQDAVGFLGDQILTINEVSALHAEKFGKRFTKADQEELIKFANDKSKEKGVRIPLDEAYMMKHSDDLKKLERAQIEREVEERLKSNHQVPTGAGVGGPGPMGKGPLEIRLDQERIRTSGGDGDKGFATWQEAAAAAGAELVKEGKF